ncbi:hypothetical protein AAMO2058_000478800 [Amorphochlora amoebiformis]
MGYDTGNTAVLGFLAVLIGFFCYDAIAKFEISVGFPEIFLERNKLEKLKLSGEEIPLRPHPKEPKIAICYSGQARSFGHYIVVDNQLEQIINPIRDIADVFFVISLGGSKGDEVHLPGLPQNKEEFIQATRPFNPVEVTFQDFEADVKQNPPKCKAAGWQMAYGWLRCKSLIEKREKKLGIKYKWVVRMRPDTIFGNYLPTFDQWPSQNESVRAVWVAGVTGCGSRGIPETIMPANDNFAIITRGAMDIFYGKYHTYFTKCNKVPRHSRTFECQESITGGILHKYEVQIYITAVEYSLTRKSELLAVIKDEFDGLKCTLSACKNNTQIRSKCLKYCKDIKDENLRFICLRSLKLGHCLKPDTVPSLPMTIQKCICRKGTGAFSIIHPPCDSCVDNAVWNRF